jgi:hypothetical protein
MKVLLSTAATNCALSCALSAEKSGRYLRAGMPFRTSLCKLDGESLRAHIGNGGAVQLAAC